MSSKAAATKAVALPNYNQLPPTRSPLSVSEPRPGAGCIKHSQNWKKNSTVIEFNKKYNLGVGASLLLKYNLKYCLRLQVLTFQKKSSKRFFLDKVRSCLKQLHVYLPSPTLTSVHPPLK